MTTFYLLRHADNEKVSGDPGLSELGRRQAEIIGKYLKKFFLEGIFTSPLLRAKQTGNTIGTILNLPIIIDVRLTERINWGEKGETFEQFMNEWEKGSKDMMYKPLFGLSAMTMANQVRKFLEQDDILDKKKMDHTEYYWRKIKEYGKMSVHDNRKNDNATALPGEYF